MPSLARFWIKSSAFLFLRPNGKMDRPKSKKKYLILLGYVWIPGNPFQPPKLLKMDRIILWTTLLCWMVMTLWNKELPRCFKQEGSLKGFKAPWLIFPLGKKPGMKNKGKIKDPPCLKLRGNSLF